MHFEAEVSVDGDVAVGSSLQVARELFFVRRATHGPHQARTVPLPLRVREKVREREGEC